MTPEHARRIVLGVLHEIAPLVDVSALRDDSDLRKTLGWDWRVGSNGGRQFRAFLWNGRGYEIALKQTIGGK